MNSNFKRWAALVVICFGQLMIVLDSTIVNVALPSIQHDLKFSQADLTWVVNSYQIAYGSFLLVAGRVGDLVGRRKVFLAGVLLFTAASVASGLSQDAFELIIDRFVQGLGGALSAGVILAMIVTEFQGPRERARAMSVFTFVIAGGGSVGLLAGGVLTAWLNWHWIFFINLPIGLGTLVLGLSLVRESPGLGLRRGIDVAGAALITAAVMTGVYAIVTAADAGWTSAHTLGLGAAAAVLLAAFVAVEGRLGNPLMPLRVFAIRSLTGATIVRTFLFAGIFTNFFMGSLYLQRIRGFSAFDIGLGFLPFTVMLAIFSAGISARLMARFGARRMATAGMIAIMLALLILAGSDQTASYFPRLFVAYILFGLGGGMSFLPLLTISMSDVPPADAGLASAFGNVAMQIGAALGLAVLGSVSVDHTKALLAGGASLPAALAGGYQLAFLLAAGSVASGLAVVLAFLRTSGGTPAGRRTSRVGLEEIEAEAA